MKYINIKSFIIILIYNLCHITTVIPSQQPLLNTTSISSNITNAKISGGATNNNGLTYDDNFYSNDIIDIMGTIMIDKNHVNQPGRFYIFLHIDDIGIFMKNTNGDFIPWSGTFNDLIASSSYSNLNSRENIILIKGLKPSDLQLSDLTMHIHFGYSVLTEPKNIIYNQEAIRLYISPTTRESEINPTNNIQDAENFYYKNLSSYIQSTCYSCHTNVGLAKNTELLLLDTNNSANITTNFNTIKEYIKNNSYQLLLEKPQAASHGGGIILSVGNNHLTNLTTLVQLILHEIDEDIYNDINDNHLNDNNYYLNIEYLSDLETLRKAALLLAGRLPTPEEIHAITQDNESGLRLTIRGLMNEKNFNKFIMEEVNNHLLTEKFQATGIAEVTPKYYYPWSRNRIDAAKLIDNEYLRFVRFNTSKAIAEEPMRLVAHVVSQERPYTEILTADYIMVNPFSNIVFNSGLTFTNNNDPEEWKEGINRGHVQNIWDYNNNINMQKVVNYPHSGILNSPAFLARYPSTATNRNRARARWIYQFFLGLNIESLAPRTTNANILTDRNNPTLYNPHCYVCHKVIDPVAGIFQNYGNKGFYRDSINGLDSLPLSYKEAHNSLYQNTDTWYRDMLEPAFKNIPVPDKDNSLQWFSKQIIADDRFAEATVRFWYPSIFGVKPLERPAKIDNNFSTQLDAYQQQENEIKAWANEFKKGTNNYGPYNLKDLLLEMIMSHRFRATRITNPNLKSNIKFTGIGGGKLLTPEQLNRKYESLTDFIWGWGNKDGLWGIRRYMIKRFKEFYGGIDSNGITERATEMNALMASVIEVMTNETTCPIVLLDFRKDIEKRLLFPHVTVNDNPDTENGLNAIRLNIQHLHNYLLGEDLAPEHLEINRTLELFTVILKRRIEEKRDIKINSFEEACLSTHQPYYDDLHTDPNHTIHAWMIVFKYLVSDYRFLYQ